ATAQAREQPHPSREAHAEVADLEDRRGGVVAPAAGAIPVDAHAPPRAAATAPSTSRHAARRPSPAGYRDGTTSRHGSNTSGQRGWKGHPPGISCGSGGSPPSPEGALRNRGSPICGNDAASAFV